MWGILRDSSSNLVRDYTRKIGLGDVLTVEIWAMLPGMRLDWKEKIINLVVESELNFFIDIIWGGIQFFNLCL